MIARNHHESRESLNFRHLLSKRQAGLEVRTTKECGGAQTRMLEGSALQGVRGSAQLPA